MAKSLEQKKQELKEKFESKKTNFLNTLFSLVKNIQEDLNDLSAQYKEVESEEVTSKKKESKDK